MVPGCRVLGPLVRVRPATILSDRPSALARWTVAHTRGRSATARPDRRWVLAQGAVHTRFRCATGHSVGRSSVLGVRAARTQAHCGRHPARRLPPIVPLRLRLLGRRAQAVSTARWSELADRQQYRSPARHHCRTHSTLRPWRSPMPTGAVRRWAATRPSFRAQGARPNPVWSTHVPVVPHRIPTALQFWSGILSRFPAVRHRDGRAPRPMPPSVPGTRSSDPSDPARRSLRMLPTRYRVAADRTLALRCWSAQLPAARKAVAGSRRRMVVMRTWVGRTRRRVRVPMAVVGSRCQLRGVRMRGVGTGRPASEVPSPGPSRVPDCRSRFVVPGRTGCSRVARYQRTMLCPKVIRSCRDRNPGCDHAMRVRTPRRRCRKPVRSRLAARSDRRSRNRISVSHCGIPCDHSFPYLRNPRLRS